MIDGIEGLNLSACLRALRRRADLSQRELAKYAAVPATTIANIESGHTTNPRFRTVEHLVRAAGGRLAIVFADGSTPEPVPTEGLRDGGERRYPAHLDVWPSETVPGYTYTRSRYWRDICRRLEAGESTCDRPYRIRRLRPGDVPVLEPLSRAEAASYLADSAVRHWVAEEDDLVVGHLGARLETGPGRPAGRLTVHLLQLDRDGAGLHLVAALIAEAERTGVPDIAAALDDDGAVAALRELGFRPSTQPPQWLVLPA